MPAAAIKLALAAYAQPAILRAVKSGPLPLDVLKLIRIAAGDEETISAEATAHRVTGLQLKEASTLLIHSAIAAAGKDNRRLLLLPANYTPNEVKTHMRWLLRWLHPDLNNSPWEVTLFNRIREAGTALNSIPEGYQSTHTIIARTRRDVRSPPILSGRRHHLLKLNNKRKDKWFDRLVRYRLRIFIVLLVAGYALYIFVSTSLIERLGDLFGVGAS